MCPAVYQGDPEAPLREAQAGGLGGDSQVAPQRQLEPAGQAPAGDRRDGRLRRGETRESHRPLGPSGHRIQEVRAQSSARLGHRLQVGAGAERLGALAGEHQHPRSVIGLELAEAVEQEPGVSTSTALRRSRRSIVSTAAAPALS